MASLNHKQHGGHGIIKVSWKLGLDFIYTNLIWVLDIMGKHNIQLQ